MTKPQKWLVKAMPSFREIYFELKKENENFTDEVIFSLLEDISGLKRTDIIINFDSQINNVDKYNKLKIRLLNGEPYQYALGYTYFLGNKFYVNENVLIPRQETEQLVLEIEGFLSKNPFFSHNNILDICSGSGVIGISLSKRLNVSVDLSDISDKANEVAKQNSILNKTNVNIYLSDMFNDLPEKKYDIIVSNPPYIKSEETVDKATLKYEPHRALFASPQTYFYEDIFKNKDKFLNSSFLLAFEIDEDMEDSLKELISKYFEKVDYIFKKDLYNKTRFLFIWKI